MRVDFYQLSRDPVEAALPLLARATLKAGERMLVVSGDPAQLTRIGEGLWALPDSFLANGRASDPHAKRQPVLLSDQPEPANDARFLALADGVWREEATQFARTFLLFDQATLEGARGVWRQLRGREGTERHFWKQEGGRWIEAA
ncbi:DNA polymerase-3 subunit chi [Novosphingobium chloroacetimidivorans]|uniref:DNA polymerase-3 subunit chi n=1 Tax=Novosphingobium chloroacetimidivorans TaxID=1428314 RepID=A0A7W7KDG2_9SPHN|nr:DNA polymerase III subunit chi [Novosphingobium chloroacetimidivorans]MBB4860460.1 DNA polymerase-3 subunit chi [Novosphingobium chloroacetimidivorans]